MVKGGFGLVFSTPFFLFTYFPLVLAIHAITPLKWRNAVLLVVNLIFYGWKKPAYILIMFTSIGIDYVHGLLVEKAKGAGNDKRAKRYVIQSMAFNLALLGFFKYWDFIAGSLHGLGLTFMPVLGLELPIGISFYTFQTMSYTVDVYRGDAKAQRNIVNFGTFVTLFPQLIAGPILKYKDLADQIDERDYPIERFAAGVQIFTVGLAKKVLLANNLGSLWDYYKALPAGELTTAGAWLGIVAFAFHLYFDFSGYSDMAVGLGQMLGFEFLGNFNYPYMAKSITDFWRRWHISLSSWFRDYLYIPLGGSRCSKGRLVFNLMAVWTATGIWHGANWNFLLWGIYYGVLLVLEKLVWGKALQKLPAALQHVYALALVLIGWALFAIEDFSALGPYLGSMLGFAGGGLVNGTVFYHLRSYTLILLLAAVGSSPLVKSLWHKLPGKAQKLLCPLLILAGLLLSTAYLVDGTYNPFLYFQF